MDRALRRVPQRIAVAGTRGKSSVTRLVAAGLRAAGFRVVAKTTGSKPVLILPDGSERDIPRAGAASIREQVRLIALAAETGADVLVSELMSIGPEFLAAESRRILRPGTLALTNVRLDHLGEMGRSKDDIARSLASAFPERADVFIPEEEVCPVFEAAAERMRSKLRPVARDAAAQGAGRALRVGEFEPNLRLARAVLGSLGVDGGTAGRGMAGAVPDFGSLRIWRGRFGDPPRAALCVSLFAANDPESSAAALADVLERIPARGRPLAAILNLREDRGDRTLQWIRAAGEGFFRAFSGVVLVGPPARAALRRIRRTPGPEGPAFLSASGSSPGELMDLVFSFARGEPVVVGLGNIAGPGERIVRFWHEGGEPDDR